MTFNIKNYFLTAALLVIVIALSACGGEKASNPGDTGEADNQETTEDSLSVGYYVSATLGDKSFFDSVNRGVESAAKELGYEAKVVEGGTDQADWPAGIESMVASNKYDIILVGTSQTTEIVADLAERYPEQKFIFFDDSITGFDNVYSMTYSQSEGSFLAGAFAALVTTNTELEAANPDKKVGFIGGLDIPIINDFKSGYEQGVQYIDPEIEVASSYIGDFADAPKAKELALAQYNSQNVDVIYQVAAAAGLGVLEAGADLGKYTIGVDDNQNGLYPGSVLTSMMKRLDLSTFRALEKFKDGTLEFGTTEVLGVNEGGIGLAMDDHYEEYVPEDIRKVLSDIEDKISKGEIKVESILD